MAALITITEANTYLDATVYPDWEALDDPWKQVYIEEASAYVQLNWCPPEADTDFDWTDDTTWDDEAEIKALIAQYSDAARAGYLYSKGTTGEDSTAPIKRTTKKVGSLELTTEYAQSDSGGKAYSLDRIADQFLVLGFTRKASGNSLLRV